MDRWAISLDNTDYRLKDKDKNSSNRLGGINPPQPAGYGMGQSFGSGLQQALITNNTGMSVNESISFTASNLVK